MTQKNGKNIKKHLDCGIIRHTLKDDHGAALFVVVVIVLVLSILCLSLIMTAGALYNSSKNAIIKLQTQEAAVSVSKEIEKEITKPNYTSFADESNDRSAGKNALWFYLRDNIKNDGTWPYYAEAGNKQNIESANHGAAEAYRYFDLTESGTSELPIVSGDTTVYMYWSPAGKNDSVDAYDTSPSGRTLYITVVCEREGGMYTVTSTYKLRTASDYPDTVDDHEKQSWNWEFVGRS
ncbi:MAG TPA: hypothetical protein DCG85_04230 [Lachnospiraceae bacterium]|nr:hypothetical protein [Lachnospiraceae bacterium]